MIDIIIVCTYLATLLLIGIYKRRKNNSFSDFTKVQLFGSKHRLLLVATIFASSIGGGTTFGIAEKVFDHNMAYVYALLIAISVDILIAKYVVPKLMIHSQAETTGDIMAQYYGFSGRFLAAIATIAVSTGLIAAQISVSGRIFEYMLEVNYIFGVIISYGIIVIYTTFGGLRSILFANQLQFFSIILSIPTITFFGLYQLGWQNFWQHLPMEKISTTHNPDLLKDIITATLGFMVINLLPSFIQRALMHNQAKPVQQAIYYKSLIFAVFLLFIALNGLIAYMLYPEVKANLALPHLINSLIPVGIQGIVIVGLLAAVMSTADSDLNIASSSLTKDLIKPILGLQNPAIILVIAQLLNFIIGSLAILIALKFSKVADLVIFISGFWGPIMIVPLVFALHNIVIKPKQLIFCCIIGAVSFLLWEYLKLGSLINFELKGVFVGTTINLTIFVIYLIYNNYLQKRKVKV